MYMKHAFDIAEPNKSLNFQSNRDCLFMSGDQCIVTHGIKKRFSSSIDCTDELVSTVKTELSEHPDNTIAFGVLPFCKTQKAHFVIPNKTTYWEKPAISSWLSAELSALNTKENTTKSIQYLQNQAQFQSSVNAAKTLFFNKTLEKIVLSKQVDIEFERSIQKEQVLCQLLQQSRSGYHFSFPVTDTATLMGVSPELLLAKQGSQIITNPLAGSTPRANNSTLETENKQRLFNSAKDRFEHAVVIEDMEHVLNPFCHKLEVPKEPSLLSTATMWHLSTELKGTLKDQHTHILDIANQLHPSPALCGKPTLPAYSHIQSLEKHSRGLFSGIIGWCDKQGNGEWVVVIRCGQLEKNRARLFAGAGIVAASEPVLEWQETDAKLKTMLNALGLTLNDIQQLSNPKENAEL
ncbi:isochorismate synthase [Pseudoalteromonas citrea]|uniref:isochorismate synthase n=2 Tax=Pseudoalteromonas citrea TaxID=43655 RepID=A0AAD4FQN8_9GAMM|nr:isochorismate synthase [Pseudoalteromonas citrea]KAF7767610.1 isochorismate synthase [Pseudoalteromonas citrea]